MALSTSGIERRLWTSGAELEVGVGRASWADWAEREAELELSWAKQRDQELPSKRTRANEGTCRIIDDSTSFTIKIPWQRALFIERKTAVFLRTQRRKKEQQPD